MSETDKSALDRERARAQRLTSIVYELQHGVNTHQGVRIRHDDKDSTPAQSRRLGTDTSVSGDV